MGVIVSILIFLGGIGTFLVRNVATKSDIITLDLNSEKRDNAAELNFTAYQLRSYEAMGINTLNDTDARIYKELEQKRAGLTTRQLELSRAQAL